MMAEDIRFYDFGLNLLYILPPAVGDCGYISINTTQELAGDGAVEIEYRDSVLEGIIADNEANVIVSWRGFDGFLTGYINEGESRRLMGMSLCGLLHRFAVPPQTEKSATAEELARAAVSAYAPFLTLGKSAGFTEKSTHSTDKYMLGSEYMKQLFGQSGGWRIYADYKAKKLVFECIKPAYNPLMLSEKNLNAYEFAENYSNKELATGGWYAQKQDEGDPVWTYIAADAQKTGINKIDAVLSAQDAQEAAEELAKKRAEYTLTAKTRGVRAGVDYSIGDVVRVQKGRHTVRKLVSGVDMWQEAELGEEPKLTDYEEGEN